MSTMAVNVLIVFFLEVYVILECCRHRLVVGYGRFGTTYPSSCRIKILLGLLEPRRWDRCVVPKRR